jgi:O-antigen/teichoic acid export membrane protein
MNIRDTLITGRVKRLISFLRFEPFDVSTPEGINNERYRRAALTTVTSVVARGVAILTAFVTVPLTLHYLGTERYGLWMTISSVIVMLGFADFGLGNGLINAIAQADGKNDRYGAQRAVSSVFFMLLGSAFFLLLVFIIIYPFLPWRRIFNVSSPQAICEAGPATAVFVVCFVLNLPLGIAQRVQIGYQEGFLNNYWQIVGNVFGLLAVVTVIKLQGGLPWLVFAMSGVPVLVVGANWYFLFFYRYPLLFPHWSNFNYNTGKLLLGTGLIFMLLWAVNVIGTSTDNIIIAQFMGAAAVAAYAIVQRLFSLTFMVQLLTSPLWPAFSNAIESSDFIWARRTFRRIQILAICLTTIICLPLVVFGKTIITIWAGTLAMPSFALVAGYALYRLVSGFAEAPMPVLMCDKYVRKLLVIATIAGIVSFVLKIVFVQRWQAAGVAWANAISYGVFFTLPACLIAYRGLKPKEG